MHESYSLFNSWNAFFSPCCIWYLGIGSLSCGQGSLSVVLPSIAAVMPVCRCLEGEGFYEVVVQNTWLSHASHNLSLSLYLFCKTLSILSSNLFLLSLGKLSRCDWFGQRLSDEYMPAWLCLHFITDPIAMQWCYFLY